MFDLSSTQLPLQKQQKQIDFSHIAIIMAERYIPEHRRTQFKAKNTFKPEELRRRREEQQVEIRKVKRDENLAKRRGITGGDGSSRPGASLGAEPDSDDDTAPTESQVSQDCAYSFLTLVSFAHYYFALYIFNTSNQHHYRPPTPPP